MLWVDESRDGGRAARPRQSMESRPADRGRGHSRVVFLLGLSAKVDTGKKDRKS